MEDKCPCIDCVVLAICNARIQRFKDYDYYILLIRRCSLYKEYYNIYTNHFHTNMKNRRLITDKVFGVNNER